MRPQFVSFIAYGSVALCYAAWGVGPIVGFAIGALLMEGSFRLERGYWRR